MLKQEPIQRLLLPNRQFSRLDTGVVHTKERIDVIHGLRADVCEFLDFGGGVLDLQNQERNKEGELIS